MRLISHSLLLKGQFTQKSLFSCLVVPNLYDILSSVEHKRRQLSAMYRHCEASKVKQHYNSSIFQV